MVFNMKVANELQTGCKQVAKLQVAVAPLLYRKGVQLQQNNCN